MNLEDTTEEDGAECKGGGGQLSPVVGVSVYRSKIFARQAFFFFFFFSSWAIASRTRTRPAFFSQEPFKLLESHRNLN